MNAQPTIETRQKLLGARWTEVLFVSFVFAVGVCYFGWTTSLAYQTVQTTGSFLTCNFAAGMAVAALMGLVFRQEAKPSPNSGNRPARFWLIYLLLMLLLLILPELITARFYPVGASGLSTDSLKEVLTQAKGMFLTGMCIVAGLAVLTKTFSADCSAISNRLKH